MHHSLLSSHLISYSFFLLSTQKAFAAFLYFSSFPHLFLLLPSPTYVTPLIPLFFPLLLTLATLLFSHFFTFPFSSFLHSMFAVSHFSFSFSPHIFPYLFISSFFFSFSLFVFCLYFPSFQQLFGSLPSPAAHLICFFSPLSLSFSSPLFLLPLSHPT